MHDYLLDQQHFRVQRWRMEDANRQRVLLDKRRDQIGPEATVGRGKKERLYQIALLNNHFRAINGDVEI